MTDSFMTLRSTGEGVYKEKGSRFLGFAYRVESKTQIEDHLDQLRKQYHDARHYCYAWILGPDTEESRANDDGEPGHSAGDPILGQIRSRNLTNVLVVVVRYFGGTKLGVSGLIQAYKSASEEALEVASTIKIEIRKQVKITYSYDVTSEVMRVVEKYDIKIANQKFANECILLGQVKISAVEQLKERFELFAKTGISARLSFL